MSCQYFVVRKKRNCRMLVKDGKKFCGEHAIHFSQPEDVEEETQTKRIPCPLDPKHTCDEAKLDKHLKKCRAKPGEKLDYDVKAVNLEKPIEAAMKPLTISEVSDEELVNVIEKSEKLFSEKLNEAIGEEILKHPIVEAEMNDPSFGKAALKHKIQNSSLLGILEARGVFKESWDFVEFGAGRGQLSHWLFQVCKDQKETNSSFLLIDRESHRHKFDNRLKHEEGAAVIERVRADIADLVLDLTPVLKTSKKPVFGVSKHLCGAATDFALRCLANCRAKTVGGVLIALCCHHRCDWQQFTGRKFLLENGFSEREFGLLCGLTSWATCGTGRPRDNREVSSKSVDVKNPNAFRYDRLELPRERREEIGKKVKRILDYARAEYVREMFNLENVQLRYYCSTDISLENVLLIAT